MKEIYLINTLDKMIKIRNDCVGMSIQPKFIKVYKKDLRGNFKLKVDPRKIYKEQDA